MKKQILDKLYNTCLEVSVENDDFFYLLENAKTEEEKQFYVAIKNFFLQQGMKKIISENKF